MRMTSLDLFTTQSKKQRNTRPGKYRQISKEKNNSRKSKKARRTWCSGSKKNNSFGCVPELLVQIGQWPASSYKRVPLSLNHPSIVQDSWNEVGWIPYAGMQKRPFCVFDMNQCYSKCFVSGLCLDWFSFENSGTVIGALNQLSADIDSLSEFQRRQFDQKDCRGEEILMQRWRPFVAEGIHRVEMSRFWGMFSQKQLCKDVLSKALHFTVEFFWVFSSAVAGGWGKTIFFTQLWTASHSDLSDEDYAVWVYTGGSSPLLPAMHAILGLRKLLGTFSDVKTLAGVFSGFWWSESILEFSHCQLVFHVRNHPNQTQQFLDSI